MGVPGLHEEVKGAVAGADDRFLPVAFQRRLAHERLGLDVAVLPGGHLIALSEPDALSDRLLDHAPVR